jgi:superoxide dismutase, Fe-Mn family
MAYDRLLLLNRREFVTMIGTSAAAFSLAASGPYNALAASQVSPAISLPPLPYAQNALAPYISENTISFHYGKHHQAYVKNTIDKIAGTELEKATLEEIIKATANKASLTAVFNNAAQVFNHTFYWNSMKPGGGGEPAVKIGAMIKASFGSYQAFVDAFSKAAAAQFGSGWAWLAAESGVLKIVATSNADTLSGTPIKPLIVIDVWEHAYYLDYQNRRADYIKAFIEKLINWDFAEKNLLA